MFDLNKEISNWRKSLLEKETCHTSDIDELESHLKDEIDQLKSQCLSEQEAFLVAAHRLGKPDALADEFAKVNDSLWLRKKIFYALCGVFAFLTAGYISSTFSQILLLLATLFGLRGYTIIISSGIFQVIIFVVVMFLWYVIVKKKDYLAEIFSKATKSVKSKVIIFTIVFLLMVVLVLASSIIQVVFVRTVGVEDYSQMAIPMTIVGFVLAILKPLVLLMILIYLWPKKHSKLA